MNTLNGYDLNKVLDYLGPIDCGPDAPSTLATIIPNIIIVIQRIWNYFVGDGKYYNNQVARDLVIAHNAALNPRDQDIVNLIRDSLLLREMRPGISYAEGLFNEPRPRPVQLPKEEQDLDFRASERVGEIFRGFRDEVERLISRQQLSFKEDLLSLEEALVSQDKIDSLQQQFDALALESKEMMRWPGASDRQDRYRNSLESLKRGNQSIQQRIDKIKAESAIGPEVKNQIDQLIKHKKSEIIQRFVNGSQYGIRSDATDDDLRTLLERDSDFRNDVVSLFLPT